MKLVHISAWVKGRGYGHIINSSTPGSGTNYDLYFHGTNFAPELAIGIDSTNNFYSSLSNSTDSIGWNYVAAVYNGNDFLFRVNDASAMFGMTWNGAIAPCASPLGFFASPQGGGGLHLPLDEIRVEHIVRSAGWLKLCYENQRTNQVLVQFR